MTWQTRGGEDLTDSGVGVEGWGGGGRGWGGVGGGGWVGGGGGVGLSPSTPSMATRNISLSKFVINMSKIISASDRDGLDIRISVSNLESDVLAHDYQNTSQPDPSASTSAGTVLGANRKADVVQAETNPNPNRPCLSGPRYPATDESNCRNTMANSSDTLPSMSTMRKRNGSCDEAMKNPNINKCLKPETDVDMDIDDPSSDHFSTPDNATLPQCQSPNCTCITELEVRIYRIMKTAFERLDVSTEQGNLEEASSWTCVINECFSWLERLKTAGVVPCGVRRGCVLLNVICKNREALDILWNRWVTGTIKLQLEEIFIPFFESEYPQPKVNIEIRICSHQYLRYWEKLDGEKGKSFGESCLGRASL